MSERSWHYSQRITTARDGSITLELELVAWKRSSAGSELGSHVRVLGPRALAERVGKEAAAVAQMYV